MFTLFLLKQCFLGCYHSRKNLCDWARLNCRKVNAQPVQMRLQSAESGPGELPVFWKEPTSEIVIFFYKDFTKKFFFKISTKHCIAWQNKSELFKLDDCKISTKMLHVMWWTGQLSMFLSPCDSVVGVEWWGRAERIPVLSPQCQKDYSSIKPHCVCACKQFPLLICCHWYFHDSRWGRVNATTNTDSTTAFLKPPSLHQIYVYTSYRD